VVQPQGGFGTGGGWDESLSPPQPVSAPASAAAATSIDTRADIFASELNMTYSLF
jgi:hypothetical protein